MKNLKVYPYDRVYCPDRQNIKPYRIYVYTHSDCQYCKYFVSTEYDADGSGSKDYIACSFDC